MNLNIRTVENVFTNTFKQDFFLNYYLIKPSFNLSLFYFFTYKKSLNEYWNVRETRKIMKFLKTKISKIVTAFLAKEREYLKNSINIKSVFSPKNLYNAFLEIKNHSFILKDLNFLKYLKNIKLLWFKKTSDKLLKGNFKYFESKNIKAVKEYNHKNFKALIFQDYKIKIIEKTLVNSLEPIFEGLWTWVQVDNNNNKCLELINYKHLKKKKSYIKQFIYNPKFLSSNFGFRFGKSIHFAIKKIKNWNSNLIWILNYEIYKKFSIINQNRLKNVFLYYINEKRLWNEIEKLLYIKFLNINDCFSSKNVQPSALSGLLHSIYMTELDTFIEKLKKNLTLNMDELSFKINKNYSLIMCSFSTNSINTHLNKNWLKNTELKLKKNKTRYWYELSKNSKAMTYNFLKYVRYKNNFLVSLNTNRKLGLIIQKRITTFIKSDLHLNIKFNQMKNRNEKFIKFLSYKIYLTTFQKRKNEMNKSKYYQIIYTNIKKLHTKLSRINAFKIKKNLAKAVKINPFVEKEQKMNVTLKKLPYHLKKLKKNKLLYILKLYYKNLNNSIFFKKENYTLHFLKLKDKWAHNLKKIELKKRIEQLQIEKPIFLKKQNQLPRVIRKSRTILIKASFSELTNFLSSKKQVLLKNCIIENYLNIICLLINTFRITKNFNKSKKLLTQFKRSYYKNLNLKYNKSILWIKALNENSKTINFFNKQNITFPSRLFIYSLHNKFTIFKNHMHDLSYIINMCQDKKKYRYKNLNQNIKFNLE